MTLTCCVNCPLTFVYIISSHKVIFMLPTFGDKKILKTKIHIYLLCDIPRIRIHFFLCQFALFAMQIVCFNLYRIVNCILSGNVLFFVFFLFHLLFVNYLCRISNEMLIAFTLSKCTTTHIYICIPTWLNINK